MEYQKFLNNKLEFNHSVGLNDNQIEINDKLFDFQKTITKWALRRGRAAIFAECGLGKTYMQLEFGRNVLFCFDKSVLIVAPLTVCEQTIREGLKLNIKVIRAKEKEDIKEKSIYIINYERLHKFNPNDFSCLILDESSILKSLDSRTRNLCIDFGKNINFRLACTATPSPNDITEIGNHCHFLGIMKHEEMLAKYFVNRENKGIGWQLKGHAKEDFYKFLSSWGIFLNLPSDLGFKNNDFILPKKNFYRIDLPYEFKKEDELFSVSFGGIKDRLEIKRKSLQDKIIKIKDLVNNSSEQWIIWTMLNSEAEELSKVINDSVNVKGLDNDEKKYQGIFDFVEGKTKVLITKSKIAGFGMNFQNCNNMLFFSLSDSYESYYQCIRRCWRYGQKKEVNIYICLAGNESVIFNNIKEKEKKTNNLIENTIKHLKEFSKMEIKETRQISSEYKEDLYKEDDFSLYLGDSSEILKKIDDESIDFSVFSPPFISLYSYTNSKRDLGNCDTRDQFYEHFKYIVKELERVIKKGRLIAVHCMQIPTKKIEDGYIGLIDFRGGLINLFEQNGFIYHSDVTIDKNPQAQAIRTHAKGLLFKQMHKDSSWSRMGLADYILTFKKKGENGIPIQPDLTNEEWITFAHPVWYGLKESETLNSRRSKGEEDEKHICPLQLPVIERCIRLWSNVGDVVLSPFAGIGSEGYVSLKHDRKFIGIELKEEYWKESINNLKKIKKEKNRNKLF